MEPTPQQLAQEPQPTVNQIPPDHQMVEQPMGDETRNLETEADRNSAVSDPSASDIESSTAHRLASISVLSPAVNASRVLISTAMSSRASPDTLIKQANNT